MPRTCFFCRNSAESAVKGGREFAACRACCRSKLLPMLADALGKTELARAANEIASEPSQADKKLARLIAARPAQAATVQTVRRPLEFSRGTGRPAAPGRRMTQRQQLLALVRAQARAEGQVYEGDVAEMVAKAGLKTYGAAELSTATAGTGTGPANKSKSKAPPSKADISEMIRKAGLTPVA
jgi:hypothetical protein